MQQMGMEAVGRNLKKKSTLRDVAKAAGVSATTVSRVLNDGPNVSADMKEKVEQAIDDLNYTPSPTARALNSGRTHTVGALVPTLDNAIFSKFLDAVEKRLTQRNLNLVISTTGEDLDVEARHAKDLLDMGAEALIVSGVERTPAFKSLIERRQVPVVVTSYYTPDAEYPTIGYDNAAITKIALNHLFDRGHRSLAVFHGPSAQNDRTRARLGRIKDDERFEYVAYYEMDLTFGASCKAVNEVLSRETRPSAIFCLSDVLALGAISELGRHKVSIPDEMAVMGFDNLAWSEHVNPPISTMELSVDSMGDKVAFHISNNLEYGTPIESEALYGELVIRQST